MLHYQQAIYTNFSVPNKHEIQYELIMNIYKMFQFLTLPITNQTDDSQGQVTHHGLSPDPRGRPRADMPSQMQRLE